MAGSRQLGDVLTTAHQLRPGLVYQRKRATQPGLFERGQLEIPGSQEVAVRGDLKYLPGIGWTDRATRKKLLVAARRVDRPPVRQAELFGGGVKSPELFEWVPARAPSPIPKALRQYAKIGTWGLRGRPFWEWHRTSGEVGPRFLREPSQGDSVRIRTVGRSQMRPIVGRLDPKYVNAPRGLRVFQVAGTPESVIWQLWIHPDRSIYPVLVLPTGEFLDADPTYAAIEVGAQDLDFSTPTEAPPPKKTSKKLDPWPPASVLPFLEQSIPHKGGVYLRSDNYWLDTPEWIKRSVRRGASDGGGWWLVRESDVRLLTPIDPPPKKQAGHVLVLTESAATPAERRLDLFGQAHVVTPAAMIPGAKKGVADLYSPITARLSDVELGDLYRTWLEFRSWPIKWRGLTVWSTVNPMWLKAKDRKQPRRK